jgi:serine/threonine protein kinase
MPLSLTEILLSFLIITILSTIFIIYFIYKREGRRRRSVTSQIQLLGERYRIVRELGRGMNAITYIVEDEGNRRTPFVAKMLLNPEDEPRISRDSFNRHVKRFRSEMENLRRLKGCKFIVPIVEFYEYEIMPFFVMEYCDGSLKDEITIAPLPMQTILDVTLDVCNGLKEIHNRGIIHRDLKPANILRHKEHWVLADFGMSLLGGQRSIVTVHDSLPGTIPYTAPEVMYYESDAIKPTADIFSLGVTLKEMLAGTIVLEGKTSSLLTGRIKKETRREVERFDDLIMKMTNLEAEYRPQNIVEVAKELELVFESINKMRIQSNDIHSLLKNIDKLKEIHSSDSNNQ